MKLTLIILVVTIGLALARSNHGQDHDAFKGGERRITEESTDHRLPIRERGDDNITEEEIISDKDIGARRRNRGRDHEDNPTLEIF